jgi:hypothetical protein
MMTTNHEMAHQMGLRCNLFWISRINQNDNLYIQYSGTAMLYGASSFKGTDENHLIKY